MMTYYHYFFSFSLLSPIVIVAGLPDLDCLALGTWYMGMFPFPFLYFLILFEGLSHHFPVHVCFSAKKRKISFTFLSFFSLLPIWLSHAAGTKYSIFIIIIIIYYLSTLLFFHLRLFVRSTIDMWPTCSLPIQSNIHSTFFN